MALLLGIGGFLFGLLSSVPAIIVGVMGRRKARDLGLPTSMATAGVVLGIIGTVLSILTLIFVVFILFLGGAVVSNAIDTADELGTQTTTVVDDANLYYADNGTYVGFRVPDAPSVNGTAPRLSSVVEADFICVAESSASITVHTSARDGQTTAPSTSNVDWVYGPCPDPGLTPDPSYSVQVAP